MSRRFTWRQAMAMILNAIVFPLTGRRPFR